VVGILSNHASIIHNLGNFHRRQTGRNTNRNISSIADWLAIPSHFGNDWPKSFACAIDPMVRAKIDFNAIDNARIQQAHSNQRPFVVNRFAS
jgi:hypothetical protein